MTRTLCFVLAILLGGLPIGCNRATEPEPSGEALPAAAAPEESEPVEPSFSSSGEGQSPSPGRITSPADLEATLKEANPAFEGEVGVQGDLRTGAGIEIHDPAIQDIRPLADLPLLAVDLSGTSVDDLGPLRGKPLRMAYFEGTPIEDISALEGMPLESLYLSHTDVEDLSPLEGAPLAELNLMNTEVRDLSPLGTMRFLKMLWLNETPVSDISPLATTPVESVTLAGTNVSDLSPLKGHPTLRRLHIARTPVTDLTPLGWMNLTRLIFTPDRIDRGMEYARNMQSLQEIGTAFGEEQYGDDRLPPEAFWERFDAGQ